MVLPSAQRPNLSFLKSGINNSKSEPEFAAHRYDYLFLKIFFSCLMYLLQCSKGQKERLCKFISTNPGSAFQLTIWRISTKCLIGRWNELTVKGYAVYWISVHSELVL